MSDISARTHNTLEIVGTHIADVVFTTIYVSAGKRSSSGESSLTDAYRSICALYARQIDDPKTFNEVLVQILDRYKVTYPGTSMSQMIDDITREFVPSTFHKDLSDKDKGGIISSVVVISTRAFIQWILEPAQIRKVIDMHDSDDTKTAVQDKIVKLLFEQRAHFHKRFTKSVIGAAPDLENHLRQEIENRNLYITEIKRKFMLLIGKYKELTARAAETDKNNKALVMEVKKLRAQLAYSNSQAQQVQRSQQIEHMPVAQPVQPVQPTQPVQPVQPTQQVRRAQPRQHSPQQGLQQGTYTAPIPPASVHDSVEDMNAITSAIAEKKRIRQQQSTLPPPQQPLQQQQPPQQQQQQQPPQTNETSPFITSNEKAFDDAISMVQSEDTFFD